ncbi:MULTISPECIES: cell division protein ZapA [Kordiimonadales]|uniref:Cell division protein ZapA n=1 Tax=Gimibacter soli TaxID=3024400 RepID=A0AAF0BLB5_9PROT|nr:MULTISPECIES: cell division protein ZapA [Kordiimonadales]WCL53942.1 cell division protein ZapA [Gimibacter soli]
MAQINVNINGKLYPLACADGEESRLHDLASYVDSKARDLTVRLGHVSEARLLLMVSLMIADELQDALESGGTPGIVGTFSADDFASVLNEVAAEVEGIAERLEKA